MARKIKPVKGNNSSYRIGWVTYDLFLSRLPFLRRRTFDSLESFSRMRVGNIAKYINLHSGLVHNELYDPRAKYDIVVFHKIMNRRCQEELKKIRAYGGRVIFDANVNYYETWGDYNIEGTKPTIEQQDDAIYMTQNSDWVVADSSYIASVIKKYTKNVTVIPDNVNLQIYHYATRDLRDSPVVVIWSGVAKKAAHLLLLKDVFKRLKGFRLHLVSEKKPAMIGELSDCIPCSYERFSEVGYARTLQKCDIIISAKNLNNAYEMGHSEYKITLGMAAGLPAVASPQPSYVEAISYKEGGIIASTTEEWHRALNLLAANRDLRADMGQRARETVIERYSTEVIANRYLELIQRLLIK